jgi:hypothetical protein
VDDVVRLRNEMTDECMRPTSGSTQDGRRVTLSTCTNSSSRRWEVVDLSATTQAFRNENSELCLESVGTRYEQRICNFNNNNQVFRITNESNGSTRMFHSGSNSTCVRGHPNVTDPFLSDTCDDFNSVSRRWFQDPA